MAAILILLSSTAAHAATLPTVSSLAPRIQSAWQKVSSVDYAISIVNSAGGASAVQGWYGTWQNNSSLQTFNAYTWDSSNSTPVLEFVQNNSTLYATVSQVSSSSPVAYLQKGWVQVPVPTTSVSVPANNPATVLGIGSPIDAWWYSAQLHSVLSDSLVHLVGGLTDKGNLVWSGVQNDTSNGQEVYRLPFTLTKTAMFNLDLNVLSHYSLSRPETPISGQLFVDKTTLLPVRLTTNIGTRRISIDLNNYNTTSITLPSTILTVDQAKAMGSSTTSTVR